jgi:hypothetical protein
VRDIEPRRRVADTTVDLFAFVVAHPQTERDVLVHRLVRIERVALEHHGNVAPVRRRVIDEFVAEAQFALGHFLEAGDHVERRRLAAARRAEQNDELLVGDRQVEVADGGRSAGIALVDVLEGDADHRFDLLNP